jgi:hypothetical protein
MLLYTPLLRLIIQNLLHASSFFLIPSSRLNSLSSYPAYHLEGQHGYPRVMALHVMGDLNVDLGSSTNTMIGGLLVWLRRHAIPSLHHRDPIPVTPLSLGRAPI